MQVDKLRCATETAVGLHALIQPFETQMENELQRLNRMSYKNPYGLANPANIEHVFGALRGMTSNFRRAVGQAWRKFVITMVAALRHAYIQTAEIEKF